MVAPWIGSHFSRHGSTPAPRCAPRARKYIADAVSIAGLHARCIQGARHRRAASGPGLLPAWTGTTRPKDADAGGAAPRGAWSRAASSVRQRCRPSASTSASPGRDARPGTGWPPRRRARCRLASWLMSPLHSWRGTLFGPRAGDEVANGEDKGQAASSLLRGGSSASIRSMESNVAEVLKCNRERHK